jgi:hypothetical protein
MQNERLDRNLLFFFTNPALRIPHSAFSSSEGNITRNGRRGQDGKIMTSGKGGGIKHSEPPKAD